MWNAIRYGHYYDDILKYTSEDGTIDERKIPVVYYDIRLGNKCNCKCIICGPVNSSMWRGSVYDWTNNLDTPYLKEVIEKAASIEKIYFTGGEPMINEHHWNMLDIFIKNSHNHNMELDYNTNGVVLNKKMFQIWSQFKGVDLGFSIDGIYEIFEKIRYPAKWKTIEKSLKLFEENSTDTIHATLAVTVSSINILNIIDLYKWTQEQNFKRIRLLPHFNVVSHPNNLSLQILDPIEKDKIKEEYETFYLWLDEHCPPHEVDAIKDSFKGLINMMYMEEGD
jgi:MoaA/NifB/PqqE/SkfB family radical SAM enzyme